MEAKYCETCMYREIHEFDNDACTHPNNIGLVSNVSCDFGCIRHKELLLKAGDWVVHKDEIYKIYHIDTDHIYIKEHVYILEDECTKWKPKEGQLCLAKNPNNTICIIRYDHKLYGKYSVSPCPYDIEYFLPN